MLKLISVEIVNDRAAESRLQIVMKDGHVRIASATTVRARPQRDEALMLGSYIRLHLVPIAK